MAKKKNQNGGLYPYPKDIATGKTSTEYIIYYDYLMELCLSQFKWENLPEQINEHFLEEMLYRFGRCLFFHNETLGFMVGQVAESGRLNHYNMPVDYNVVSVNREVSGKKYYADNSVLIWNNELRKNSHYIVNNYSKKLADLTRIIEINQNAQKTPITIVTDSNNKLSYINAYNQYDGNAPVMIMDKDFDKNNMGVFQTGAPYVVDRLQLQKNQLWRECMTLLGIENTNMDKKERMVVDEVNGNNDQVQAGMENRLKVREQACDEINRMFPDLPQPVSVKPRIEQKQEEQRSLRERIESDGEE